jgi:hypothetical protein
MAPPDERMSPVLLVPPLLWDLFLSHWGWDRTVMGESPRMFLRERGHHSLSASLPPQAQSQSDQFESTRREWLSLAWGVTPLANRSGHPCNSTASP